MQKITPNLWYDSRSREAANFYQAAFADSKYSTGVEQSPPDCSIVVV